MGGKDEVCVRWIRRKPSWTSRKTSRRTLKTKCSASWSRKKSKMKMMKKNPRKTWSISKACSKAKPTNSSETASSEPTNHRVHREKWIKKWVRRIWPINSNYSMKSRWSNCRNKSDCSRRTPTCGKRRKLRRLAGCNLRKIRKSVSHNAI
jgi:hypothetical protein